MKVEVFIKFVVIIIKCTLILTSSLQTRDILKIVLNIDPKYISFNDLESRKIKCIAELNTNINNSSLMSFNKPLFEWKFGFENAVKVIDKSYGCNDQRNKCWQFINIEPHLMLINNSRNYSMNISCIVSDSIQLFINSVKKLNLNAKTQALIKSFMGNN